MTTPILNKETIAVSGWATVRLHNKAEALRGLRLIPTAGENTPPEFDRPLPQYIEMPDGTVLIPRALAGDDRLVINDPGWQTMHPMSKMKSISFRTGQEETINAWKAGLSNGSPYGGIIQAVTGAGKTFMGIKIAMDLQMKTLIIVPRTSLMQQWKDKVLQYTNIPEERIGIVQGTQFDIGGKDIVIAMIHTLAQKADKFTPRLFTNFGLVIYDETHVLGAETFSKTAPLFWCKYRLGLSATPRRSDGMDDVFFWHIGKVTARFTRLQAAARVRMLPYRGGDAGHEGCVWGGNLNLGRYFNRLMHSPARTTLIGEILMRLYNNDEEVLLLADRIQMLNNLKQYMINKGVPAGEIGLLTGTTKQIDRKVILGTYGSAGMGVDIPRLSALVLATPRAEIEQAVGRVLRQGTPIVVDIVDTASGIMKGWAKARLKFYKRISGDIKIHCEL